MGAQPVVRKVPFSFHSPNFSVSWAAARGAAIKRTVNSGASDQWDASTFGYDLFMSPTVNGTIVLFHKQAVTTGDVKFGSSQVNDATFAVPFTNSTIVLPGWDLDSRIYNTDAAAQTYVAVFSPHQDSILNSSWGLVDFDMSSTTLLVRPNDTVVFREIVLTFFRTSSYMVLPNEIVLSIATGKVANLNYPTIATRRLQGTRLNASFGQAQSGGNNPIVNYGLDHPVFLRGTDSAAGVNDTLRTWSPYLYAPAKGMLPGGGSANYLFQVTGELYQNANRSVGYQGG